MKWYQELEATLGKVTRTEPVHGGSINDVCRITLADKRMVFVKTHAAPPPGMYAAEAHGLTWLRAGPLRVPRVIAAADSYLALEWIDFTKTMPHEGRVQEDFGRGLAQLHLLGAPAFGLDRDNFLATLVQDNTPAPDIVTFFVERRLAPVFEQIRLAEGMPDLRRGLDTLRARPELFGPPEPPARLHGDLWTGNVAVSEGEPVIFDPAVYGGHREIDLAMLDLFGGLRDPCVDAYREESPLADGWRARLRLWQLYPLACHAVLFGGDYVKRTAVTLDAVLGSR
ncbi:MAG: fructosamine kinase family protein [Kofleriaceae bacterium]